jgi:vacuolar-type H+-ATPase subunit E/Vma4
MRKCELCPNPIPNAAHFNRRFCDACRKAKRKALERARSQTEKYKAKGRENARRYRLKNLDMVRKKQADRYYANKIRSIAAEEAKRIGLPVETVLQQWGAL